MFDQTTLNTILIVFILVSLLFKKNIYINNELKYYRVEPKTEDIIEDDEE